MKGFASTLPCAARELSGLSRPILRTIFVVLDTTRLNFCILFSITASVAVSLKESYYFRLVLRSVSIVSAVGFALFSNDFFLFFGFCVLALYI